MIPYVTADLVMNMLFGIILIVQLVQVKDPLQLHDIGLVLSKHG